MICISFFADQEIDESEKSAIFNTFKHFSPDTDESEFNSGFGLATNKFIDLKSDEARENQYILSLEEVRNDFKNDINKLIQVIESFIEIANADEFIHENEILLISQAIDVWGIKKSLIKDKNNDRLFLKD